MVVFCCFAGVFSLNLGFRVLRFGVWGAEILLLS